MWKVKKTQKRDGGYFDWGRKLIEINNDRKEQEQILLHEIMEIILTEKRVRFYNDTDGYQFVFDHKGFTDIIETFYGILKDNKLI